ncbi:hypothetical protein LINGRAHAP2_LOCUS11597 [Linum grandiflorum]
MALPRLPMMCGGCGGGGRRSKAAMSPKAVRRPPPPTKPPSSPEQTVEFLRNRSSSATPSPAVVTEESLCKEEERESKEKVMVVVDSSVEAKSALEWALFRAVKTEDSVLFLLYVSKSSHPVSDQPGGDDVLNGKVLKAYELLYSLKTFCERTKPGVEVDVITREGRNRGPVIVEEAKRQRVSLLVLGQRKRRLVWRLMRRLKVGWRRRSHSGDGDAESSTTAAAEVKYCIQNATCMTLAVRRKGKKLGGYLITDKHRKNFWLLA